jgi:hypothetical protein
VSARRRPRLGCSRRSWCRNPARSAFGLRGRLAQVPCRFTKGILSNPGLEGIGFLIDPEELEVSNKDRYVGVRHSDPVPGTRKIDVGDPPLAHSLSSSPAVRGSGELRQMPSGSLLRRRFPRRCPPVLDSRSSGLRSLGISMRFFRAPATVGINFRLFRSLGVGHARSRCCGYQVSTFSLLGHVGHGWGITGPVCGLRNALLGGRRVPKPWSVVAASQGIHPRMAISSCERWPLRRRNGFTWRSDPPARRTPLP